MAQVAAAPRLRAERGVRLLDRGDRRAAAQGQGARRGRGGADGRAVLVGRSRARPSARPTLSPRARWRTAVVGGHDGDARRRSSRAAGMIAPDMATMLGYVFTDAAVEPAFLQQLLSRGERRRPSPASPSTATPRPATPCSPSPPARRATRRSPRSTTPAPTPSPPRCTTSAASSPSSSCATAKARRSSSRSRVTGAVSDDSARRVGLAVANSPLVKTAIAGEDANWGRVVMAVGKAGEPADRDKLSIGFGGTWAARDGLPLADYDEAPVAAHLKGREIDDRGRPRPRRRPRHGVDLRPDPRLHLDQRRLPELMHADDLGPAQLAQRQEGRLVRRGARPRCASASTSAGSSAWTPTTSPRTPTR